MVWLIGEETTHALFVHVCKCYRFGKIVLDLRSLLRPLWGKAVTRRLLKVGEIQGRNIYVEHILMRASYMATYLLAVILLR